jgi:transcriptional regulator with XRE-family HTH domain
MIKKPYEIGMVERIRIHQRTIREEFIEQVLIPQRKKYKLTQKDIADIVGIDQAQVSRLESGEQVPKDFPQALAYKNAYRLDKNNAETWYQVLYGSALESVSEENIFDKRSLPDFLGYIENELRRYQEAIDDGIPQRISQWLSVNTIPSLRKKIPQVMRESPSEVWPIQQQLAKALFDYGESISYWMPHWEAYVCLNGISRELDQIADQSNQKYPKVLSDSIRASAYHLIDKFDESRKFAEHAILTARGVIVDANFILGNQTLLASALAALKMDKETKKEGKRILRTIEDGDNLRPTSIRGGLLTIARIESVLGNRIFWKKLEEAGVTIIKPGGGYWDAYTGLRLIYTELKGMLSFSEIDIGQVDKLVREALLLSAQHERLFIEVQESARKLHDMR